MDNPSASLSPAGGLKIPSEYTTLYVATCPRCRQEFEAFAGKRYCDPCIAEQSREREQRDRAAFARDAAAEARRRGLLRPGALSATFGTSRAAPPQNAADWATAAEWSASGRRVNLYICGPWGTGKTHLARCLLRAALEDGWTVGELCGRDVATISNYAEVAVDNAAWARLLLVDDLDKANWTPNAISTLWCVLDRRERDGKRTIVTSNMEPRALRDYLLLRAEDNESLVGAALDRLRTTAGRPIVLRLTGESLRGAQEAESK